MGEGERDAESERSPWALLRILSDELLTPVTVLQGVAQTLALRPDMPIEHQETLASAAQRAAARLRRLVENLSLADALATERIHPHREACGADELLAAATRSFPEEPRLRHVPSRGADAIRLDVDLDLAIRALVAVVENALEFSPATEPVDIRVTQQGPAVDVAVVDRGPGIPEDLREEVFDLFVQGEAGDTRNHSGMGLGLHLAQAVMRLHAGSIHIERTPAGENVLILRFPAECTYHGGPA